jgi:predicted metalloprotease with PDZ domain
LNPNLFRVRFNRAFCAALLAAFVLSSGGALATPGSSDVVAYDVSPEFAGQTLVALDVTATWHADASGTTTLLLPDQDNGASVLWKNIKDLKVDGAQSIAEDGPAKRVVTSAPGAALTLHYRVVSALDHDPTGDEVDPYKPIIRPHWFWIFGEALFVYPENKTARAQFHWDGAKDYPFASDLEHANGQPMSMTDLTESVAVGGPDLRVFSRQIGDARLRVAMIGHYGFTDEDFVSITSRIVAGERKFWGGHEGPFLVALAATTSGSPHINADGNGRGDAFAILSTPNIPLSDLEPLLAHEYFHTWNPIRMGGMAAGEQEPSSYWFSEGFTDYYKRPLLLRMGLYSLEAFIADWNKVLMAYAGSPVRLATNQEIVRQEYSGGADIHDLPYQRGSIMAARWDRELKKKSHGKLGLDQVMRAMPGEAAKLGDKSPVAPDLFVETMRRMGLDIRTDAENVIEQGKPALLPKDAFGECIAVVTKSLPLFDRGFDFMATVRNGGIVTGLEPGGPAERAGIRDGMRIAIDEQRTNDSQQPLTYTYKKPDGTMEKFVFKPQGNTMTTLQQLQLAPGLTDARRSHCAKSAAG